MVWDIDWWNCKNLLEFLVEWVVWEFGCEYVKEIVVVMEEYYWLNFLWKLEYL